MPALGDSPHGSCPAAIRPSRARARRLALVFSGAAACAAVAWTATGLALGAGSSLTLKATRSPKQGEVVVNSGGLTVYALAPEATGHLLCTSGPCLSAWPPVTVRSARTRLKAGAGVRGRMGILRRSNGKFQVTLAGHPLYRFSGDSAKGDTNGQGIQNFGGTWHVIAARAAGGSTPAGGMTPTPTSPRPGY